MLKKIIAVLLLVTVLLTVTACGKKVDTDEEASVVGRGDGADSGESPGVSALCADSADV